VCSSDATLLRPRSLARFQPISRGDANVGIEAHPAVGSVSDDRDLIESAWRRRPRTGAGI
jgi:hypothetical protein